MCFAFVPVQAQTAPSSNPDQATANAQPSTLMHYTLPPDKLKKAHALYVQIVRFQIFDAIYGFFILAGFLYFGVIARYRNLTERATPRRWLQGLIVLPLFVISTVVLTLPSDIYHQHVRREYGISIQGWGSWWGDWGKSLFLVVLFETALLMLLYTMIRRSRRRWWFYGWLVCVPVVIFIFFISPVVLEPMFYKFTPLEQTHPELVTQIEQVVKRGGLEIPRSRMYLMDASAKLTGDNAYVSGFGASKRVVVWDTTAKHMTGSEIMFVFGHEMGHYVLGHIVIGMTATLLLVLFFFYLAYRMIGGLLRRWGSRWQIRDLSDWASVPLLVLLLGIFTFVANPIENGFSRYLEHQADIYGLEVTHGLVPGWKLNAARTFQILGENWLEYPYISDFYAWWAWDHPTTAKRMVFAQEYDPWAEGKEPKYVKAGP